MLFSSVRDCTPVVTIHQNCFIRDKERDPISAYVLAVSNGGHIETLACTA